MHAQGIYMLVGGFFRLPKDLPRAVWHYPVSYLGFHMYGLQVKKLSNFTFTTSCSGMCFLSISMQNSKQQIKDSSCPYLSAGDVQEWFSGTHIRQLYSKWKGHYSSDTWILCGGKHVWHPNQSREMGRPGRTVRHDSCVQTPVLHLHQTEWRLATTGSCLSDAISYCKEDQQQVVWFTWLQLPAITSSPSLPVSSPTIFEFLACMQDLTLNLLHVTNSPYQLFGGLISQLPNTGCYLFCEASRSWHCTVLRLNDVDPLPQPIFLWFLRKTWLKKP